MKQGGERPRERRGRGGREGGRGEWREGRREGREGGKNEMQVYSTVHIIIYVRSGPTAN